MRRVVSRVSRLVWVAAGALTLGLSTGARAQTGGAPFNTTSPSTNPLGLPDPTAPPPSRNDVTPGVPATAAPTAGPAPTAPPPAAAAPESPAATAPEQPAAPSPAGAPATAPPPETPGAPATKPPSSAPAAESPSSTSVTVVPPGTPEPEIPPAAPTSIVPPPAGGPPPRVNVNPAPPTPPPLRRNIEDPTVAIPGASDEKIPVQPLPPMAADHGEMYRPGMYAGTLASFGWAFVVGGGYEDFTNSTMRGLTTGAGAWDVRVIGGTRSYLGFEAAYVGSARNVTALGAAQSTLIENGFEGTFRVNVPVIRSRSLYEPYGFIGLGYSHYNITNYSVALTSDFASGDNVMTMPFGAGFAYGYGGFIADARFTYTATYFSSIIQGGNTTGGLNHFGVGGNVGFTF